MGETPILYAEHISKRFDTTQALDDVTFEVMPGEVHALVGENGAGKSTLVKIICGAHHSDAGRILLNGKECVIKGPKDALNHGIASIYQEFSLLQDMSVTSNLFVGREKTTALGIIKTKEMQQQARELCRTIGLDIDEKQTVSSLSTAEKQMLEIVKGIAFHAKIIFMDEPSAILTESEVQNLFSIIRSLTKKGVTIVYISHRLKEIFEIADRVTVLKDGKHVITAPIEDFKTKEDIVRYMIGREIVSDYYSRSVKHQVNMKEQVLSVKNLSGEKVQNISFNLYKGEILGFSGLVGAGRTEIVKMLFGADKSNKGEIWIRGNAVEISSPKQAIKNGIGFIPEDRAMEGIILEHSIRSNISLAVLDRLVSRGFINFKKQKGLVQDYINRMAIKLTGQNTLARQLSGGNQQKAIVAKWLATESKILIMDEPTRGIDVGAKAEIYRILRSLADQGVSLIIVSSELPETLSLCDRVLVVREGKIVAEVSREAATEELIMLYATGQKKENYESVG